MHKHFPFFKYEKISYVRKITDGNFVLFTFKSNWRCGKLIAEYSQWKTLLQALEWNKYYFENISMDNLICNTDWLKIYWSKTDQQNPLSIQEISVSLTYHTQFLIHVLENDKKMGFTLSSNCSNEKPSEWKGQYRALMFFFF